MCLSRPTNPSANVVSDEDLNRLADLAEEAGIPLLLDNAYGWPFPGVIHSDTEPFFRPELIQTLSLSKLGLPGTRTGIVIGPKDVVDDVASMTAITGLANNNLGQALLRPLLDSNEVKTICETTIRPFYRERRDQTIQLLEEAMISTLSVMICLHLVVTLRRHC